MSENVTAPQPAPAAADARGVVVDFPGMWTTHPMTRDGAVALMGQFWHAVEGATIHYLPGEQPTAEEIAKSEEAGRIAKAIEQHVIAMLSMPFAPATPAAEAARVSVDAAALDLSALGEIRAVADTLGVCGSGTGATKMRQMATALRAACDALASATPAVAEAEARGRAAALAEVDAACEALFTDPRGPGWNIELIGVWPDDPPETPWRVRTCPLDDYISAATPTAAIRGAATALLVDRVCTRLEAATLAPAAKEADDDSFDRDLAASIDPWGPAQ